jgi:hypothetical protein
LIPGLIAGGKYFVLLCLSMLIIRAQLPLGYLTFSLRCQSLYPIDLVQNFPNSLQQLTTRTKTPYVSARKFDAPSRDPQMTSVSVSRGTSRSYKIKRNRRASSRWRLKSLASTLATWFAAATTCDRQYSELISRLHRRELLQPPHTKAISSGFGCRSCIIQKVLTWIGVCKVFGISRCDGMTRPFGVYT